MPTVNPYRKALERPLVAAVAAIGMDPSTQIEWPLTSFDTSRVSEYIRFTYSEAASQAKTLGASPRVQKAGYVQLDAQVQPSNGAQDRIDQILGQQGDQSVPGTGLLAAYPYAQAFALDEITVNVMEATRGRAPVFVDGFWYMSAIVNWTVWRS